MVPRTVQTTSTATLLWITVRLAGIALGALFVFLAQRQAAILPITVPTALELAEHYAPVWYQDTDDSNTSADYVTRADFDGDWRMADNWEEQGNYPLPAWVYWSMTSTSTHWYLTYAVYHPRDWSSICISSACHENDLEGAQLMIRRDGTTYGRLEAMETIFHYEIHKYYDPAALTAKSGIPNTYPALLTFDEHPLLFIEARGHGVEVNGSVTVGNGNFPGGDGVVYRYRGVAEEPDRTIPGGDRDVGYGLLSIRDELWSRRTLIGDGYVFDDPVVYSGTRFQSNVVVGSAFDGDNYENDRANPPWGWEDTSAAAVERGDWAIDPLLTFSEHFTIPPPYDVLYADNFYLLDLGNTLTITAPIASTYLLLADRGPYGTSADCENSPRNHWCKDGTSEHWPQSALGCYEIADDVGSDDCRYDTDHTNFIHYAWTNPTRIHRDQLNAVTVTTDTSGGVCGGEPSGYEGDDGWGYGTLQQVLHPSNAWSARRCQGGGNYGPYQWTALFDADGYVSGFEVRAGDHYDEGAFRVTSVTLDLRRPCVDGTQETMCSASKPYVCSDGLLRADCEQCGCPSGLQCSRDGTCRLTSPAPGKREEVTPL